MVTSLSKSRPLASVHGTPRLGRARAPCRNPYLSTPGSDLSGEVVAVGPAVSELRVGDQVHGVTNAQFIGAYAEYAVASATMVSKKPTSLTYIEAASVPVVAVIAWQALFDHAQIKEGQTLVIHGAARNVGACAVQLARRAGVRTSVREVVHGFTLPSPAFITCSMAATMLRYAPQRQMLPLINSRISSGVLARPSLIRPIAEQIWPGVQ